MGNKGRYGSSRAKKLEKGDRLIWVVVSGLQWKRVARISAWLLLAALVVSVLSGWGITRTEIVYKATFGLVDRGLANRIHRDTQIPMVAFFLVHVLVNAKIRLLNWRRITLINIILIAIGVGILIGAIYMEV